MRLLIAALAVLPLSGCMCRPGVIDCTTNRAYPGFCKPLCGGPCDPFMWIAGDCSTCCCCAYCGGYTPYGGRTICGEEMVYSPSCVAPPLRWEPPAFPAPPIGHVVHLPPAPRPAAANVPPTPPVAPPAEAKPLREPDEEFLPPVEPYDPPVGPAVQPDPMILHDARNERPERSRL